MSLSSFRIRGRVRSPTACTSPKRMPSKAKGRKTRQKEIVRIGQGPARRVWWRRFVHVVVDGVHNRHHSNWYKWENSARWRWSEFMGIQFVSIFCLIHIWISRWNPEAAGTILGWHKENLDKLVWDEHEWKILVLFLNIAKEEKCKHWTCRHSTHVSWREFSTEQTNENFSLPWLNWSMGVCELGAILTHLYENLDRVESSWRKRAHFTVTHIQTATHSFMVCASHRIIHVFLFKFSRLGTTRIIWYTLCGSTCGVGIYSCCWTQANILNSFSPTAKMAGTPTVRHWTKAKAREKQNNI